MNERLEKYRKELDVIDRDIVKLLADRIALSRDIGKYKRSVSLEHHDPEREAVVVQQSRDTASEHGLDPDFCETIMKQVITHSKLRESESSST